MCVDVIRGHRSDFAESETFGCWVPLGAGMTGQVRCIVWEREERFELVFVFLKPVCPHPWHLCPVNDLFGAMHAWA